MALHISRKQSLLLTAGIFAAFIGVGALSLRGGKQVASISFEQKSAEEFVPGAMPQDANSGGTQSAPALSLSKPATEPTASATPAGNSLFSLERFERSEVRDGRKIWEVSGSTGQYFPENNSARITDAVLFVSRKEGETTELTTRSATVFLSGASLTRASLEGAVRILHQGTTTLESEKAEYDQERNVVSVPAKLTISGQQFTLTAGRMEGSLESQKFVFSGGVKTVITPNKKGSTR